MAILRDGEDPESACVDCADDAVRLLHDRLEGRALAGVGVDAPLWWSSCRSSDRRADKWLRETYTLSGGAVQTANSLKGAALVQAAMFIVRLRETFGAAVPVTEVHPKALLRVLAAGSWSGFAQRYGLGPVAATEHERDAVIGAVAAREGFSGRWSRDLSTDRLQGEQDPQRYWLAPVHYFWPEP